MVCMLNEDQRLFPQLATFIRQELKDRAMRPGVWKAFCSHSNLNKGFARSAVTWGGNSPLLRVAVIPYNGKFSKKAPEQIILGKEIADRFEQDYTLPRAQLCIESTVLHELIHWGNEKTKTHPSHGDAGTSFELEAYNEDVDRWLNADGANRKDHPSIVSQASELVVEEQIPDNNPGLLRWQKESLVLRQFETAISNKPLEQQQIVFRDPESGMRALTRLLKSLIGQGMPSVYALAEAFCRFHFKHTAVLMGIILARGLRVANYKSAIPIVDRQLMENLLETIVLANTPIHGKRLDHLIELALAEEGYL